MKPKNFPDRKNKRRLVALKQFKKIAMGLYPFQGIDFVIKNTERNLVENPRDIQTKKRRD